jgi:hypothetical protein
MANNTPRSSIHRFSVLWLAVVLAGCMSMSATPRATTFRPDAAPAPLGAQDAYEARRPVPPVARRQQSAKPLPGEALPLPKVKERDLAESDPDELPEPVRVPIERGRETVPPKEGGPSIDLLPRIEPDDITVEQPLELMVAAPTRRQVGGTATYRVTLRNTSDRPFDELVVRCRFGDALVFSGSDRREVLQHIARLPPGEAKSIELSLASDRAGSHCCRFTAARIDADHEIELAAREVCVEFVTRHVEIDLLGPIQRTEGSRAEFNVTLSNLSHTTIGDVQAIIAYDRALVVKEASAEAEQRTGQLTWRLGQLRPMEKVQLQVEFECRTQAHRACIRVEVKGADVVSEREEACLEVVPVPGTLDLRISDRDDPFETGRSGAYEVTVQNIGLQTARRIVLDAAIPESVKVRSVTVRAGDRPLSLKYSAEPGKLIFDPVEQLAPNARLIYTFEVEALRAGSAEFRASLTSALSSTAVTVSEPTTIVDP